MGKSSIMSWEDYKHLSLLDVQNYYISNGYVIVERGLVSKEVHSLPIYMIISVELHRSMIQRIFGLCTIVLHIRDECEDSILLENICYDGKELYLDMLHAINKSYRRAWFDHHLWYQ